MAIGIVLRFAARSRSGATLNVVRRRRRQRTAADRQAISAWHNTGISAGSQSLRNHGGFIASLPHQRDRANDTHLLRRRNWSEPVRDSFRWRIRFPIVLARGRRPDSARQAETRTAYPNPLGRNRRRWRK